MHEVVDHRGDAADEGGQREEDEHAHLVSRVSKQITRFTRYSLTTYLLTDLLAHSLHLGAAQRAVYRHIVDGELTPEGAGQAEAGGARTDRDHRREQQCGGHDPVDPRD